MIRTIPRGVDLEVAADLLEQRPTDSPYVRRLRNRLGQLCQTEASTTAGAERLRLRRNGVASELRLALQGARPEVRP